MPHWTLHLAVDMTKSDTLHGVQGVKMLHRL